MAKKSKSDAPTRLVSSMPQDIKKIVVGLHKDSLIKVSPTKQAERVSPKLHVFGEKYHVCKTDSRGFATPDNNSPLEIVVDASNGFIPLWAPNMTLNWRFNEASMQVFVDPDGAKSYIKSLMGSAVGLWGEAQPVKLSHTDQPWDFEVIMMGEDDCSPNGCVLASAFFPNGGQNQLVIYPKMFGQPFEEQVETMAHEFGHIWGLRHFFAQVSETAWDSEIYGTHSKFSIMNYGANSFMTATDISDLKNLYDEIWNQDRRDINGTRVELFMPYSAHNSNQCVCA